MPNVLKKKRRSSVSTIAVPEEECSKGQTHHHNRHHHQTPSTDSTATSTSRLTVPPSPSSSKTAISRRSSLISFSLPQLPRTPKKKASDSSLNSASSTPAKETSSTTTTSSSPSALKAKLTPIKSLVAKKVKRQIQRLDDAIHVVLPTAGRGTGGGEGEAASDHSGDAEEALVKPKSKFRRRIQSLSAAAISSFHPQSSPLSSAKKSTLSTLTRSATATAAAIVTVGDSDDDEKGSKTARRRVQPPPRSRTISCPVAFLPETPPRRIARMPSSEALSPSLLPVQEERAAEGQASSLQIIEPVVEEDVPDPFLVNEKGGTLSSEGGSASGSQQLSVSPAPISHDVPLSKTASPSPQPPPAIPLSPPTSTSEEPLPSPEEEEPKSSVPVIPTIFLPIPNVRRSFSSNLLVWWLSSPSKPSLTVL